MMMSLFSMFDPMANFKLLNNWITMLTMIFMFPLHYWKMNSRIIKSMNIMIMILDKELKSVFMTNIMMKGTSLMMMSCFIFILMSNLTSNFPYTFCFSAHISFSMSLSIPLWLSIIIYQWTNLTKTSMAHLVPTGTPPVLMPLMVMIEMTSNFIRPLALAVRLSANLIAGHLLMALLGNTLNIKQVSWMTICLFQTMFLVFELMVAMIQAYVFSVLITLYSSEIN